tara:strand:- start:993 stop:1445 length:453 start_codon:yes stop_codon:yes gene_type:complete
MSSHEHWMKIALKEAQLAMIENEIPVGAVLVQGNKLIAQAHNRPIKNNDPTAHAEIEVLRKAGAKLKNYRIPNSTLYVTLEPCTMCYGAMVHARIDKIIFGASDLKSGVCGTAKNLALETFFNHKITTLGGILENDCKKILQSFFKLRRK